MYVCVYIYISKVSCSFGRELLFRYQDTVKERCLLQWDAQHRNTDAPDMQRKKRTLFYLQVLYFLALLVQKCTYWR
jgi:hypothetical protein